VEPSRIVLVDMPRILREIIERAVADEPDMEIVDSEAGNMPLREAIEASEPDFVIAGADYDFGEVARVLDERPRLRVLAVAGDGREAFLYELRPTRTPLGEVSPRTIVEAIRGARYATS
jgi:DNA-binding NarL/FixJ family response regulator